jgi:hypothetical protein
MLLWVIENRRSGECCDDFGHVQKDHFFSRCSSLVSQRNECCMVHVLSDDVAIGGTRWLGLVDSCAGSDPETGTITAQHGEI